MVAVLENAVVGPERTCAEELLASQEPWWQALAVARAEQAPSGEFQRIFREALHQLEPLAAEARVRWADLVQLVLYWATYRRPSREHAVLKKAALASIHAAELRQEVQIMSEVLEKIYEQEVFERGLTQGEAKALRRMLQTQLRQRFGDVPEVVQERIEAAEVAQLEAAITQVLTIATPGDLSW